MYEPDILDARMEGFRIVFIIMVPMMVACLFASLFVADVILKGDARNEEPVREPQHLRRDSVEQSSRGSAGRSIGAEEVESGRRVSE